MPSQNLQDAFLNTARKECIPVTIYLTSGVKLAGRVRGFDKYCIVFESNHQEQLIFKHAISTVVTANRSAPRESHARHTDEHSASPGRPAEADLGGVPANSPAGPPAAE